MSSTKIAMAQPHSFQSGAFSFMSCTSGRESSPMDETNSHQASDFKSETKKKRFHPLRNLRRMFRRKTRRSSISADSYQPGIPDNSEITSTNLEQRSCSTSRLQEENLTQNLIRNSRLNPGLSLSHDSIFTPDRADSGLSSSDLENSSLSITVLTTPSKSCPIKSQSSCSETSLLSIGSSEAELSPTRIGKLSDLDVGVTAYKLSHSAAKHKMAVKPRRNHGAPRNRRRPTVSTSPLPTTLETGEESATDRISPIPTPIDFAVSPSFPKIDKPHTETKISWSQLSAESSVKEPEVKAEDESDVRKEEMSKEKTESFFGRFLSRRSDKKKKQVMEVNEEGEEERHHFVKKTSKPVEIRGRIAKSPNRRQRVEPFEIPFGLNQKSEAGDPGRKKLPSPVSPSKAHWQSSMTSRSMSPPRVIWSENSSQSKSVDLDMGEKPSIKVDFSDATELLKKDLRNPEFMKELTDCVSSLKKEVTGKRKVDEEDEEAALKIRRQHSEDTPQKLSSAEVLEPKNKSASSESMECVKNPDEQNAPDDGANVKKNADDLDLRTFSVSYEKIHDGYENIQIIELVKQEVKNLESQTSDAENKPNTSIKQEKQPEIESVRKETPAEKPETEQEVVVRRAKPLVSEKPKDLKRGGGGGGGQVNRVPSSPEEPDGAVEKIIPKTRTTLVERRKSELFMMSEGEERDWKAKMKPLKKQTSFSEAVADQGNAEDGKKIPFPIDKTETTPEVVEEVVLRKKSTSVSDEQPELMKVFARRSLKVRESEKLAEEVQKSRDSDKENEMTESPKEDRKKSAFENEKRDGENLSHGSRTPAREKAIDEVLISVPLLKPETASRKNVIHRYGRSLSENNAKSREESTILEENKMNNLRIVTETYKVESRENDEAEEEEEKREETGFKKIQQRKAEWERRAQQGAK